MGRRELERAHGVTGDERRRYTLLCPPLAAPTTVPGGTVACEPCACSARVHAPTRADRFLKLSTKEYCASPYVCMYGLETGHACLVPPGLDGHSYSGHTCGDDHTCPLKVHYRRSMSAG